MVYSAFFLWYGTSCPTRLQEQCVFFFKVKEQGDNPDASWSFLCHTSQVTMVIVCSTFACYLSWIRLMSRQQWCHISSRVVDVKLMFIYPFECFATIWPTFCSNAFTRETLQGMMSHNTRLSWLYFPRQMMPTFLHVILMSRTCTWKSKSWDWVLATLILQPYASYLIIKKNVSLLMQMLSGIFFDCYQRRDLFDCFSKVRRNQYKAITIV